MSKIEKKKFLGSLKYPAIMLGLMWLVLLYQELTHTDLYYLGIYPRTLKGLPGIFTTIFEHGGYKHLINNSLPFFVLSAVVFYFYKPLAWRIHFFILLFGGIWTWIIGRPSYHIGASGLIFGLFAFIMFSGFFRKNNNLIAVSFIVILEYGSMLWGMMPVEMKVSWESHLCGFLAGLAFAFYYKKQGPKMKTYELNDDDVPDGEDAYWRIDDEEEGEDKIKAEDIPKKTINFKYTIRKNGKKSQD